MEQVHSWETNSRSSGQDMESEDTIPCSQEPTTGPYRFVIPVYAWNGAGVAQTVQLRAWKVEDRFPAREKDFSALSSVQNGCGAHPAFYTMGTWELFPLGVNLATHLRLVPTLKMVELYLRSTMRPYSVVLN
jgi:hypothetical protein